jgi:hypothetical protein
MITTLLTIGVLGAVMFGMAIGVIVAGKTLRGSCGGVGYQLRLLDRQAGRVRQALSASAAVPGDMSWGPSPAGSRSARAQSQEQKLSFLQRWPSAQSKSTSHAKWQLPS